MKILIIIFTALISLSLLSTEKFSAIEELITLSENEDKLAVEVNNLIENLEVLITQLKRFQLKINKIF